MSVDESVGTRITSMAKDGSELAVQYEDISLQNDLAQESTMKIIETWLHFCYYWMRHWI